MATAMYFEEKIADQGREIYMDIELGRSSFYSGGDVKSGKGEDSIYLCVDEKQVIMDRATAKRFVKAVIAVGQYHGLVD